MSFLSFCSYRSAGDVIQQGVEWLIAEAQQPQHRGTVPSGLATASWAALSLTMLAQKETLFAAAGPISRRGSMLASRRDYRILTQEGRLLTQLAAVEERELSSEDAASDRNCMCAALGHLATVYPAPAAADPFKAMCEALTARLRAEPDTAARAAVTTPPALLTWPAVVEAVQQAPASLRAKFAASLRLVEAARQGRHPAPQPEALQAAADAAMRALLEVCIATSHPAVHVSLRLTAALRGTCMMPSGSLVFEGDCAKAW